MVWYEDTTRKNVGKGTKAFFSADKLPFANCLDTLERNRMDGKNLVEEGWGQGLQKPNLSHARSQHFDVIGAPYT